MDADGSGKAVAVVVGVVDHAVIYFPLAKFFVRSNPYNQYCTTFISIHKKKTRPKIAHQLIFFF
jgi:hypothetical protein